jgi:hypothetical protein
LIMVNRDDVIAYLLHEMPEAERAEFTERWFTDPESYQRLLAAEAELLDDFVRGKVLRNQRRRVEAYLLGPGPQQRKLQFAEALRSAVARPDRVRVPWAFVAAALLVMSIGLLSWLGLENRRLQREVARLDTRLGTRLDKSVTLSSGGVYTLVLPSDTLRGQAATSTAQVTPGIDLLSLELELRPGDESRTYSATVSAGDQTVWSEGPLRPEPIAGTSLARLWIPVAVLAPGYYSVRLESAGSSIAYYRFAFKR